MKYEGGLFDYWTGSTESTPLSPVKEKTADEVDFKNRLDLAATQLLSAYRNKGFVDQSNAPKMAKMACNTMGLSCDPMTLVSALEFESSGHYPGCGKGVEGRYLAMARKVLKQQQAFENRERRKP